MWPDSTISALPTRFSKMLFMHSVSTDMYKRAAYICTGGEVKEIHDEGYGTISAVFVARPKNCQYAVVVGADETVYLVDMFDLMIHTPGSTMAHKPDTTLTFPSVEVAIMYALATY